MTRPQRASGARDRRRQICQWPNGCRSGPAPTAPETDWVRDGYAAYFDQITVTSRYSSDHTDTYSFIRLLEAGRIDAGRAISHRFDIHQSAEAFRMLVEAEKSLKIIVYPHGVPANVAEVA